jgi:hypothetical protein
MFDKNIVLCTFIFVVGFLFLFLFGFLLLLFYFFCCCCCFVFCLVFNFKVHHLFSISLKWKRIKKKSLSRGRVSLYNVFFFSVFSVSLRSRVVIPRGLSPPAHVGSNSVRTDVTMWESLSVYLRKVSGLSPNTLYNVSRFSLPPIKIDRHHINEKLLSMAKMKNKQIAFYK